MIYYFFSYYFLIKADSRGPETLGGLDGEGILTPVFIETRFYQLISSVIYICVCMSISSIYILYIYIISIYSIDIIYTFTHRFFFLINLFILFILFLAVLGLRCCEQAFSSCGEQVSYCGGFSCCRARAPGTRAQ